MKFLLIELPLTVYVYGTGIPSLRLMQNIQSICINPIFDRRHTNNGSIKKGFIGRKERLETVNQIKVSGSIQSYYYFAIIFDYFLLFDNIFFFNVSTAFLFCCPFYDFEVDKFEYDIHSKGQNIEIIFDIQKPWNFNVERNTILSWSVRKSIFPFLQGILFIWILEK